MLLALMHFLPAPDTCSPRTWLQADISGHLQQEIPYTILPSMGNLNIQRCLFGQSCLVPCHALLYNSTKHSDTGVKQAKAVHTIALGHQIRGKPLSCSRQTGIITTAFQCSS